MFKWVSVESCLCSDKGSIEDKLSCAPCPPPMISYKEFRDHALNRSLLLKDVCIIARRCYINGTDIATDCTQDTQDCPPNTTVNIYNDVYVSGIHISIIVTVTLLVLIALVVILIVVTWKLRRKIKCKCDIFKDRCYTSGSSVKGKSYRQTSSTDIEMTLNDDEGKENAGSGENSALINDEEEFSEKYVLAMEEMTIEDSDTKFEVQIHDTEGESIPENVECYRQEHPARNVQDNSRTTVQRNSEDNTAEADRESFHSAEGVPYMDS